MGGRGSGGVFGEGVPALVVLQQVGNVLGHVMSSLGSGAQPFCKVCCMSHRSRKASSDADLTDRMV